MKIQEAVFRAVDLLEVPAFAAREDAILYANPAARAALPQLPQRVEDLLRTGHEAYRQFRDGCLHVTARWPGGSRGAEVNRMGDWNILSLDREEEPQLAALALAARELRSPLGDLMALTARLSDQEAHKFNQGLHRLLRIVTNMSDAGTLEQQFRPELLDLDDLLRELTEKLQFLMPCPITYKGTDSPAVIQADPQLVERAVLNLVANAARFLREGEEIALSLSCRSAHLSIRVWGGQPIAPELIPGIFHRYLRSPGLEDGRYGMGLGLALVRSAAAVHGGAVLIDCPQGQSTRVTITLPVTQPDDRSLFTPCLPVDYSGEQDHVLLELADVLPGDAFPV